MLRSFIIYNSLIDNFLEFFISVSEGTTRENYNEIASKIDGYCNEKRNSNLLTKSPKKIIKTLYKEVHLEFLEKYELENEFTSVFKDGRYNCVSGSAMTPPQLD